MEKESIQTQAQFDNYDIKIRRFDEQTNTYLSYTLLNKKELIKKRLNKNYVFRYSDDYLKFLDVLFDLCASSRDKGMIALLNHFKKDGWFLNRLYFELVIQWGIKIAKPLSYAKDEDKVTIELIEVFVNKLLEVEI